MKINPAQSQPITPYATGVKKMTKSSAESAPEATSGVREAMGDLARVKDMVKQLNTISAVRPEVVSGRSAEDPVKAFDGDALKRFISALSEQA